MITGISADKEGLAASLEATDFRFLVLVLGAVALVDVVAFDNFGKTEVTSAPAAPFGVFFFVGRFFRTPSCLLPSPPLDPLPSTFSSSALQLILFAVDRRGRLEVVWAVSKKSSSTSVSSSLAEVPVVVVVVV